MEGPYSQTMSPDKRDVLLVDDNPMNLVALEVVLGDVANVTKVGSGEEALRRLLEQDFALALVDVQMPGMDGFETAELIRGRERTRHLPIIFVTAYSRTDVQLLRAYELGAVDFLFKPLEPAILRSKVMVFLDLHRKTEEVRRQADLLRLAA